MLKCLLVNKAMCGHDHVRQPIWAYSASSLQDEQARSPPAWPPWGCCGEREGEGEGAWRGSKVLGDGVRKRGGEGVYLGYEGG